MNYALAAFIAMQQQQQQLLSEGVNAIRQGTHNIEALGFQESGGMVKEAPKASKQDTASEQMEHQVTITRLFSCMPFAPYLLLPE
jgi:hypothetical protein